MRLFISFYLCLHYTQVSQIKALYPKLRFHDLKMLASFEFGGLQRPSTHSHPACCQDGDGDNENDNWYVHGHIENFWGIASPDDQHIIGSPLEILPVQKHKNNSNFLKYFHSFGLAIPNYWQSCMFFSLWLTDWHLRHDAILRLIFFISFISFVFSWRSCWTNSRSTGDFRPDAHFDATVIFEWQFVVISYGEVHLIYINQFGNTVNNKKNSHQNEIEMINYQLVSQSFSVHHWKNNTVIKMKSKSSISFSIIRCSWMTIDSLPNKGLQFCN